MAAAPPPSPARFHASADPWTVSSASRSDTPTSARPYPAHDDDDANDESPPSARAGASVPEPPSPRVGADTTSLLHRRLSAGSASAAASRMRLEVSTPVAAPASEPNDDTPTDSTTPRRRHQHHLREHPHPHTNHGGHGQSHARAVPQSSVSPRSPRVSSGTGTGTGPRGVAGSSRRASLDSPPPSPSLSVSGSAVAAHLRERLRATETRAARAESSLRDARDSAAALARDVADHRERVARLDASLAECSRARDAAESSARDASDRATAAETRAVIAETELAACRLSRGARCDAALKAAWLARYWRLAFRLGVAPESSWREAELWSRRAPDGGDDALRRVVDAAAAAAEGGFVAVPAFLRADVGGAADFASGFEPNPAEPRGAWTPTTLADAIEVEVALRTMTAMRVEEAVLVALADRRRALADRRVDSGTAADAAGADDEWIRLSPAEEAEVAHRRAWLCYAWFRARAAGVEPGLAQARCELWFPRATGRQATFEAAREALEVEEGLREIRELGVEYQLWRRRRADETAR
jgi:hypothetical protein